MARKPEAVKPLSFKRGDSMSLLIRETVSRFPRDLSGFSFRAQARTRDGALVEALTVEPVDLANGCYRVRSAGTAGWPVGRVQVDVERVDPSGVVKSTPTVDLVVDQDVTREAQE